MIKVFEPKVCAIMATCGRHTCAERSLGLFLNQDYQNKHLLIFQNSPTYQKLNDDEFGAVIYVDLKRNITLVNNSGPFSSLGDIYDKALEFIPLDTDIITFWDDDDIFLPNHISEGVKGYFKANKNSTKNYIAYKPAKSYYRSTEGITLTSNTLEPSIFVDANHIIKYGFSDKTTEQHLQWVNPLVENNQLFVDPGGLPTLIYNWGDRDIPTYKTSGDFQNPNNFSNVRNNSQDHGDGILTPNFDLEKYYNLVPHVKKTS